MPESTKKKIRSFFTEALHICIPLFKIMIPVIILVKILREVGAIEFLGQMIGPVMSIMGLPGIMGLVWATSMVINLYAGMVVFLSLVPGYPLSVAQVTVLTGMMLVAHSLPVELKIAQKGGARLFSLLVLRIGGALLFGFSLMKFFSFTHMFSEANKLSWATNIEPQSVFQWALGEARNLVMIFLIILVLLFIMKTLEKLKIISLIQKLLAPIMKTVGIGKKAIPLTVVGLTLGLAYGGGLIIKETQSGTINKKDAFFSLAFLSLCHGLIEDTLLMVTLGGRLEGILVARIIFSFVLIFVLVKLVSLINQETFEKYLYK